MSASAGVPAAAPVGCAVPQGLVRGSAARVGSAEPSLAAARRRSAVTLPSLACPTVSPQWRQRSRLWRQPWLSSTPRTQQRLGACARPLEMSRWPTSSTIGSSTSVSVCALLVLRLQLQPLWCALPPSCCRRQLGACWQQHAGTHVGGCCSTPKTFCVCATLPSYSRHAPA